MSTIFAMYANHGKPAIVLAADTQMSMHDEEDKPTTKKQFSKVRTANNHAILFAGTWDNKLEAFISYITGERSYDSFVRFIAGRSPRKEFPELDTLLHYMSRIKEPAQQRIKAVLTGTADNMSRIEEAISEEWKNRDVSEGTKTWTDAILLDVAYMATQTLSPVEQAVTLRYLQSFNLLNRFMKKKDDEYEAPDLIIGTSKPELSLYKVDIYGNLHEPEDTGELEYICMGTGADLVKTYVEDGAYEKDSMFQGGIRPDKITIPLAVRMSIKCLKEASKDMYTSTPFELAVITADNIKQHSGKIRNSMEAAEREAYRDVVLQYEAEPVPEVPQLRSVPRKRKQDPNQLELTWAKLG
ncbi:hypothetical protein ACFL3V_00645 [Nanoarchaeota archaeon]